MSGQGYGPPPATFAAMRALVPDYIPADLADVIVRGMYAAAHDPALPVRDRSVNAGWMLDRAQEYVLACTSASFKEVDTFIAALEEVVRRGR